MSVELCPSMMCSDIGHLDDEIHKLEDAGADMLHLDLMDGHYVPNFSLGIQDIRYICSHTRLPSELHVMIESPSKYLELFVDCGVDFVYLHPDSDYHIITSLQKLSEMGIGTGIVLNPGTSVYEITELVNVVDRVLVMGVNPGDAGQMYLSYAEKKIDRLLDLKADYNFSIGMDGACNKERICRLAKKGVEHFVLGTAAIFSREMDYLSSINEIRQALKS